MASPNMLKKKQEIEQMRLMSRITPPMQDDASDDSRPARRRRLAVTRKLEKK